MASTASASASLQLGAILAGRNVTDQRRQVGMGGLAVRWRVLEGFLEVGDRQRQQDRDIGRAAALAAIVTRDEAVAGGLGHEPDPRSVRAAPADRAGVHPPRLRESDGD